MTLSTWYIFKIHPTRTFVPPEQSYRVRSRFISIVSIKWGIGLNPGVENTHCCNKDWSSSRGSSCDGADERLRPDPIRTEAFRVHPTSLVEIVVIAHNADYNFNLTKLGWNENNPGSIRASSMSTSAPFRPEPINRINAEREDDDEAEHQVAEQHNLIRRCYVSESNKHFVGNRE